MADQSPAPAVAPRSVRGALRRARPTAASLSIRMIAVLYVGVLVLVPVAVLVYRALRPGLGQFVDSLSDPYTEHAFQVTAVVAVWSILINTVFGVLVAVLLARHEFPGKRVLNAVIDLPIAVSPIVVGFAFVLVFGVDGWFGSAFASGPLQIIGAKPGMVLVTAFVSLPLVLRAVLPVLEQAGSDQELAAASLGASWVSTFWRITLPSIRAALTYGVVLGLARCIGEYGAVLVVSGNVLGQTETVPLRIDNVLTQDQNRQSAYDLALVLIAIALLAILLAAHIRRKQPT